MVRAPDLSAPGRPKDHLPVLARPNVKPLTAVPSWLTTTWVPEVFFSLTFAETVKLFVVSTTDPRVAA
jgi:hypothetical protein